MTVDGFFSSNLARSKPVSRESFPLARPFLSYFLKSYFFLLTCMPCLKLSAKPTHVFYFLLSTSYFLEP